MLSENKIMGDILKIKSEDIMDYVKVFIFKRVPVRIFSNGL
jgi:hypothetical protein